MDKSTIHNGTTAGMHLFMSNNIVQKEKQKDKKNKRP